MSFVSRSINRLLAALLAVTLAVAAPAVSGAQETVTPSERVSRNVVVRAEPSTSAEPIEHLLPGGALLRVGEFPVGIGSSCPMGRQGLFPKPGPTSPPST